MTAEKKRRRKKRTKQFVAESELLTEQTDDTVDIKEALEARRRARDPAAVVHVDDAVHGSTRPLFVMLAMVATFAVVEFVVGIVTGSLALLSDAFHMVSDLISLVVGIAAIRLSTRKQNDVKTFGWQRAEVLGGLINSVFLLSVVFFIILETVQRFLAPEPIDDPELVLGVGIGGLVINIIGLLMLFNHRSLGRGHGHSHEHANNGDDEHHGDNNEKEDGGNFNLHGVFLHVLGDALGSVAVVVSALLSMLVSADWVKYADPALSLLLALLICKSSLPLFRASVDMLMQGVPRDFDMHELSRRLLAVDGVDYIGRLHVWSLAQNQHVASLHIDVTKSPRAWNDVLPSVRAVFTDLNIASVTVQPHFVKGPLLNNRRVSSAPLPAGTSHHQSDDDAADCNVCVLRAKPDDPCCK